jgi:hypothetical protein
MNNQDLEKKIYLDEKLFSKFFDTDRDWYYFCLHEYYHFNNIDKWGITD